MNIYTSGRVLGKAIFVVAIGVVNSMGALAQDPEGEGYAPIAEYQVFGEPASEGDGEAIMALMGRFGMAWGSQDVEGAVAAYSTDAEWTNAFGDVRRGHEELRDKFEYLFKYFESGPDSSDEGGEGSNSDSNDATSAPTMKRGLISTRYIGEDVAVLHSFVESDWGVNRDGSGKRLVHMTFVLEKREGEWLIVHHMIMDVRR